MIAEQDSVNPSGGTSRKKSVFDDYSPEVRVRTKKMMMWFIIFAIVMIFAGFTSGYIVKNAGEFWVHIEAPTMLYVSLVWLLISSLTMIGALRVMKRGKKSVATVLMAVTFAAGIGFTVAQYAGWQNLAEKGMGFRITETEEGQKIYAWNRIENIKGEYGVDYTVTKNGATMDYEDGEYYLPSDDLRTNPVSDKVRKQSNIGASFIYVLIIVHIIHLAFGLIYIVVNMIRIIKGRIHQNDTVRLYTNGMYWHFMGILWVYLFIFLFYIH